MGAGAFATDPHHYDFSSKRCIKDLTLRHQTLAQDNGDLELRFEHNCWKHEEDLTLSYRGLRRLHVDLDAASGPQPFTLVLDEILPHPDGCHHEIAFWGGTIVLVAQDLIAA